MDVNALKGLATMKGISIPKLIDLINEDGAKISKTQFYKKLRGLYEFDRKEIIAISKVLELNDAEIMAIFFN